MLSRIGGIFMNEKFTIMPEIIPGNKIDECNLKEYDSMACVLDKRHIAECDYKHIRRTVNSMKKQHSYRNELAVYFVSWCKEYTEFFKYIVDMVNKCPDVLFFTLNRYDTTIAGTLTTDNHLILYSPTIWYIFKKFHHLVPDSLSFDDVKRRVRNNLLNFGLNKSESQMVLDEYFNVDNLVEPETETALETIFPTYSRDCNFTE